MKKDTKKATAKRREVQKKDMKMKLTRATSISMDMNLITHIMTSMAKKVESMEAVNMVIC